KVYCVLLLRFAAAFWFCVLLIEDSYCVLPREDSASFKTWLRFVSRLGCVLSQDLLHFVSRLGCVLSRRLPAFCLEDFLRFVSRPVAFCLKTWLRFVSRPPAFCLKTYCVLSPEDIQCVGSDTRPPMLDRTDFASWQQRIRLYCQGKKNGVNILKSIDEGPYQMGTVREPLAEGTEGAPHLGLERPRVYSDLSPEEKDRFITAVKLNRGLRDSNYDQLYAYLKQHETHAKENKMMLEHFSQHTVDPLALMSNVSNPQRYSPSSSTSSSTQGRQNRGQGMNPRGGGGAGYGGVQNRVGNANPGQARHVNCYNRNERLLFLAGRQDNAFDDDVDEQPVQDLALSILLLMKPDNHMIRTVSEVQDHDHYQDAVCAHHEEHVMHDSIQLNHVVDSHADYTSDSNMISYDQNPHETSLSSAQDTEAVKRLIAYAKCNREFYKSELGLGVKLLEPGFELDDQEWVEMGSFLFVRLEMRRKWGMSYNERFMALFIHEMDLEAKVRVLEMQVTLHDKRIVMQVTLHYEGIVMLRGCEVFMSCSCRVGQREMAGKLCLR
nr:integrase, catalytic region, zinc finger, CCHC-type, peptidase aspartic, catalytic [Tanacetum cinerariifolium]